MLTVKAEVERLLKDMRIAAMSDARKELETIEIASIAMNGSMPVIDDETPDSLISLHAQAHVVRAWRQHAENIRAA